MYTRLVVTVHGHVRVVVVLFTGHVAKPHQIYQECPGLINESFHWKLLPLGYLSLTIITMLLVLNLLLSTMSLVITWIGSV